MDFMARMTGGGTEESFQRNTQDKISDFYIFSGVMGISTSYDLV